MNLNKNKSKQIIKLAKRLEQLHTVFQRARVRLCDYYDKARNKIDVEAEKQLAAAAAANESREDKLKKAMEEQIQLLQDELKKDKPSLVPCLLCKLKPQLPSQVQHSSLFSWENQEEKRLDVDAIQRKRTQDLDQLARDFQLAMAYHKHVLMALFDRFFNEVMQWLEKEAVPPPTDGILLHLHQQRPTVQDMLLRVADLNEYVNFCLAPNSLDNTLGYPWAMRCGDLFGRLFKVAHKVPKWTLYAMSPLLKRHNQPRIGLSSHLLSQGIESSCVNATTVFANGHILLDVGTLPHLGRHVLKLYNSNATELLATKSFDEFDFNVVSVKAQSQANRVAILHSDATLRLLDAADLAELACLKLPFSARHIACMSDTEFVVVGTNTICVCDYELKCTYMHKISKHCTCVLKDVVMAPQQDKRVKCWYGESNTRHYCKRENEIVGVTPTHLLILERVCHELRILSFDRITYTHEVFTSNVAGVRYNPSKYETKYSFEVSGCFLYLFCVSRDNFSSCDDELMYVTKWDVEKGVRVYTNEISMDFYHPFDYFLSVLSDKLLLLNLPTGTVFALDDVEINSGYLCDTGVNVECPPDPDANEHFANLYRIGFRF